MIYKQAYAKINLALDVLGVRADGLHEVDLILTPLILHDTLSFALLPNSTDIELIAPDVPGDVTENLIFKAAQLVQTHFAIAQGVQITLEKRIPIAAGLAGGSSDAAATLRGLVELWSIETTDEVLHTLATMLGADVPYCLYQQTMQGQGIGDRLQPLPAMLKTSVVLFKPQSYGIAAGDAYGYIDEDQAFSQGHVERMVAALQAQDYQAICQALYNGLEGPILRRFADLAEHRTNIANIADAVLMSGSGPTLFAFAQTDVQLQKLRLYGEQSGLMTIQTETKEEGRYL